MAHLWVRDGETEWAVAPLGGDVFTFVPEAPHIAQRAPDDGETALMRATPHDAAVEVETLWVLLVSEATQVRVNGSAVVEGIRALDDRDEICGPAVEQCFFSTEQLASVVPSPGGERPTFCPRCKLPVETASPAVRCPVCGVWHHQDDRHPCWSYSEECAVCRHDTDLERGYRWSPEEL